MNGGCSDDSFEYFRCWVISRGKDTYYKTKANPDHLINEVVVGADLYDFESFWYVALQAFEKRQARICMTILMMKISRQRKVPIRNLSSLAGRRSGKSTKNMSQIIRQV
jgi:hypothetical protein